MDWIFDTLGSIIKPYFQFQLTGNWTLKSRLSDYLKMVTLKLEARNQAASIQELIWDIVRRSGLRKNLMYWIYCVLRKFRKQRQKFIRILLKLLSSIGIIDRVSIIGLKSPLRLTYQSKEKKGTFWKVLFGTNRVLFKWTYKSS